MLKRITLENFMSHTHTVIEPGKGLTVLVGPNNCGKSAVVEALRVLCRNLPGEVVVRHGEKLCRVVVETDDGHVITWQRKGKAVRYDIDGLVDDRPGRAVPAALHEALRLPEVETAADNFDIHFGMQKSPMFLLGEKSEAKVAAFFASSSDAEKLMEMQAKHREKVRNAKQRRKENEEELERWTRQLAALAALDAVGPKVESAEAEYAAIRTAEQETADAGALLDDLNLSTHRRAEWVAHRDAMRDLKPLPPLADVAALERLIQSLEREEATRVRETGRLAAISALSSVPVLPDTALIESVIAGIRRARLAEQIARHRLITGEALSSPPALEDARPLERTCRTMETALAAYTTSQARSIQVSALAEPPPIDDPAPLERLLGEWADNRRRATRLALDVVDADAAIDAMDSEIRAWIERNPTCPLCGGAIEADKLLAGGHAHA